MGKFRLNFLKLVYFKSTDVEYPLWQVKWKLKDKLLKSKNLHVSLYGVKGFSSFKCRLYLVRNRIRPISCLGSWTIAWVKNYLTLKQISELAIQKMTVLFFFSDFGFINFLSHCRSHSQYWLSLSLLTTSICIVNII